MRFDYYRDVYYFDCHHGDILICFIDRDYHTFALSDYHIVQLPDNQNFKSNLCPAMISYNDVKVSPAESMLRIITSLVLL